MNDELSKALRRVAAADMMISMDDDDFAVAALGREVERLRAQREAALAILDAWDQSDGVGSLIDAVKQALGKS